MDTLERYINQLFSRYPKTQANQEARDEILSNLRARIADDLSRGLSEKEAIANAKKSIPSLDFLDSKQRLTVSTRAFALNILQHVLLCLSVAWVVTLPLRMFHGSGRILNTVYLLMIIAVGILFLLARSLSPSAVTRVSLFSIQKASRWVWILFALFLVLNLALVTGIRFGSNLWFSRPVQINGPYQFALLAADYLLPVTFLWIPLSVQHVAKATLEEEVQGDAA